MNPGDCEYPEMKKTYLFKYFIAIDATGTTPAKYFAGVVPVAFHSCAGSVFGEEFFFPTCRSGFADV